MKKAMEILEADDSDEAKVIIEKWNSVSDSYRKVLRCEDFALAAGLSNRRFIEVLSGAIMQQAQDVTRMLVATAQPKVTKTTIRRATQRKPILNNEGEVVGYEEGDFKSQELFHKITGMLPTPKGSQTIIQMGVGVTETSHEDVESNEPAELQTMDAMLLDMQDVIRPQLEAPKETDSRMPVKTPEIEYLDAEI